MSNYRLNAINAPDLPSGPGTPSGMDLATVLQVPVTCICDVIVVARNWKSVAWPVIWPMLSTTVVGIGIGSSLMGAHFPCDFPCGLQFSFDLRRVQ